MRRTLLSVIGVLVCLLLFVAGRMLDEGMWLLDSINKLPLVDMKKSGLELSPEQIYSVHEPSLKDAIILLGGGTGSFVSAEGLIITNHHVAFGAIQSLSSLENDYLKNGFWARNHGEELPTSYTAQIVNEVRDVTPDVLSAVNDTMNTEQRTKAIQARSLDIERSARGTSDLTCRISETFNGLKYYLYTYHTLNDVRLVYAPPGSIGNYGGEVDNWMWPRHTGDFSFMRAYVGPDGKPAKYSKDNVPFTPKKFLTISTRGYHDGSFVMLMGFPGRTFRYREAAAVQLAGEETLPTTISLYKARIDVIENAGNRDRSIQIKYASKIRGIANSYKNYLATLAGMHHAGLLSMKRHEEENFAGYLNANPDLKKKYGTLLSDLEAANAELRTINRKSILLSNLVSGVDLLSLARKFRAYALSFTADGPPEKEKTQLKESIASSFKNLDLHVDSDLLSALILKSADFPADQQLETFLAVYKSRTGIEREHAIEEYVTDLYQRSHFGSREECEKMMERDADDILDDPCVHLATAIEEEQAPVTARLNTINASLASLRRQFVQAWLGWKKGSLLYPDANRTIRLTYGAVMPLSPRDAVAYRSYTTLGGVIEKEQDGDPFVVPPRLKELWQKKDFGRYAEPKSNDVPVAFLSDLDITGGNSGSPVINGRGELIGCAFDGNWEGVVGDYYFQEEYNRTISVDVRYVLFLLDRFSGAENILRELVIQ
jgi:hypothetical protein